MADPVQGSAALRRPVERMRADLAAMRVSLRRMHDDVAAINRLLTVLFALTGAVTLLGVGACLLVVFA